MSITPEASAPPHGAGKVVRLSAVAAIGVGVSWGPIVWVRPSLASSGPHSASHHCHFVRLP
jgi:hypothetical protein